MKLRNGVVRTVCQDLLTASSENFAAALRGQLSEGSSNVLNLDDAAPITFDHYIDWLYSGKLLCNSSYDGTADFDNLFDIYLFADHYLIPQLKRAVITRVIEVSDAQEVLPNDRSISKVFRRLPENDPLLDWVVNQHVALFCSEEQGGDIIDKDSIDISPQFVIRLVNRMAEVSWIEARQNWDVDKSICDYHNHDTKESLKMCQATGSRRDWP